MVLNLAVSIKFTTFVKNLIMPKLSFKGLEMPQSPIRKLAPFADKATEEGKQI